MMMLAGLMMKMMLVAVVVKLKLYNIYASRYFAKRLPNPRHYWCRKSSGPDGPDQAEVDSTIKKSPGPRGPAQAVTSVEKFRRARVNLLANQRTLKTEACYPQVKEKYGLSPALEMGGGLDTPSGNQIRISGTAVESTWKKRCGKAMGNNENECGKGSGQRFVEIPCAWPTPCQV